MADPRLPSTHVARSLRVAVVVTVSASSSCGHPPVNRAPNRAPQSANTTSPKPAIAQPPSSSSATASNTVEDALVEDAEGITNEPELGPEPKRSYNPHDYTLQRNPDHYIGKVILRESDGTCFIKGKIPGGCQHTGPCFAAVTVPCPKEMLDPAYAQCRAGVVYENPADHTCGCWEIGNPARFHLNDCPEETK